MYANLQLSKNTGDRLIYYFPKTYGSADISDFKTFLECGLTMIDSSKSNPLINAKLQVKLLSLYYRINADYGRVEIANSTIEDLSGPTLSICAKINSMVTFPNEMVIGDI